MANQWFRMYHEFATDPKVQMLGEADQRRFVMLLCLKCCNDDVTLHDEEVAFQLRISIEEYTQTKAKLIQKGLIEEDNTPTAWDRRQFASDSSAARVAKHRERKKAEQEKGKKDVKRYSNAIDTDTDTDTDTDNKNITPPSAAVNFGDSNSLELAPPDKPKTKKPKQSEKFSFADWPEEPSPEVWADFERYRKAKKAPLTQTAVKGMGRELSKASLQGWTVDSVLAEAMQRNWQGVKAHWLTSKYPATQNNTGVTNHAAIHRTATWTERRDDLHDAVTNYERAVNF